MAAAEGTFMIHGPAILYARWRIPEVARKYLPEMEKGLAPNVQSDLDWLETEPSDGREYLVGKDVTAADILMGFNIESILARKLGIEGKDWPHTRRWLQRIQQRDAYQKCGREDRLHSLARVVVLNHGLSENCGSVL
ncbi:hypothetical protein ABEF92_007759 [Exophiala dermatitidis]|uniref:GST C-terminal domain-containing protein n=1 Tax=Exophiala dermatitidis (strain ATCC 34100 / CBS 525.76 / NIH/UT8656) TaxID=858893 RepID=H6C4L5_EXODN|nr:uncharacterized protein HMPREF1120_06507 [Exophiala dermatitidis NIH/UT8656]EHY58497.1 hypothetical protein HMPREF1120_06507 [Exophiala dermatitidis NIH/UT8656]